MAKRSSALRFKLLSAFALAVVVGWSVLWFVAATIVDRQIDKAQMAAADAGAMADCADRVVTGFPFRIEVRCGAGSRVTSTRGAVTTGGLTLVTLVYNPDRVIAEMASPLTIASAVAPEMNATWQIARASAQLDFAARSLERLDAELTDATLDVSGKPPVAMAEANLNIRRSPESADDLDLALSFRDIVSVPGGRPVTIALRGRLAAGASLLAGRPEALVAAVAEGGLPFAVESAILETDTVSMEATGDLRLGADGHVDGALDIAVAGADTTVAYLDSITPGASDGMKALMKSILEYAPDTTLGGRSAKRISLVIEDGRVRAGVVPLFTVPPLTVARR